MTEPPMLEWEQGWDGHRDAQARRFARLPLPDKVRWLEEAQRIANHLEQARQIAARSPGQ
jgi:hypothetical protein